MYVSRSILGLTVGLALVACSGGRESADQSGMQTDAQADTSMAMADSEMADTAMMAPLPDWMSVDRDARSAMIEIAAAQTADNNHWNFNGYFGGDATITVPEGYTVTIRFTNDDPVNAHSIGVSAQVGDYPGMFTNPEAAFAGAMSSHPADIQQATKPGATETLQFTAGTAGKYALLCYVPGHAAAGMWIHFDVVAGGKASFQKTM